MVLQLVRVLPVLMLAFQTVGHQQSVLPQFVVEGLILALPPLLVWVSHQMALVFAVVHQQFPLFSPQVV